MPFDKTNSEGLRIFPNLRYAEKPRLVDFLPRKYLEVKLEYGSKVFYFTDPIYINSPFKLAQSFSTEFTDTEIISSQAVEDFLVRITGYVKKVWWTLE